MNGMGIGEFLPNEAIIKRKFRWTMRFLNAPVIDGAANFGQQIPEIAVTIAARPNLTIEETEINFLNEKDYIPAKPTWDPLQITLLDFGKVNGTGADVAIREWVQRIYWFDEPGSSGQMSDPAGHGRRDCQLTMWDGVGHPVERWTIYNSWVQASNWGDLDYSATENATVELTVRFQNANFQIFSSPGGTAQRTANNLSRFEANGGGDN